VLQLTARIGKLSTAFFSDGTYIAAPASSQSPDCLVEITFLLRLVGRCKKLGVKF
jgi:hypothetical protein